MSVCITCPKCDMKIRGKDKYAGRVVSCPKCGKHITMPSIPDSLSLSGGDAGPAPPTETRNADVPFPSEINVRQPVWVRVRDVDIEFGSMVVLIIKFWVATLIALAIVAVVVTLGLGISSKLIEALSSFL